MSSTMTYQTKSHKIMIEDTYSHTHMFTPTKTTYNRVLDIPDSFSSTILKLGLCSSEKWSGETGYQKFVTQLQPCRLITSMNSPICKQNSDSFVGMLKMQFSSNLSPLIMGAKPFLTRTRSQFKIKTRMGSGHRKVHTNIRHQTDSEEALPGPHTNDHTKHAMTIILNMK